MLDVESKHKRNTTDALVETGIIQCNFHSQWIIEINYISMYIRLIQNKAVFYKDLYL